MENIDCEIKKFQNIKTSYKNKSITPDIIKADIDMIKNSYKQDSDKKGNNSYKTKIDQECVSEELNIRKILVQILSDIEANNTLLSNCARVVAKDEVFKSICKQYNLDSNNISSLKDLINIFKSDSLNNMISSHSLDKRDD